MLKFQKLAIATMAVLALTACSKKEKAAAPETKMVASACTSISNDGIDWSGAQQTTLGGATIHLLAGNDGDVSADCDEAACTLSGTGKVGVVGADEKTIEYASALEFTGTVTLALDGDDITCEATNVVE